MHHQRRLIDDNIGLLAQGRSLIGELDDRTYIEAPMPGLRAGVGGHFRHVLDFYDCFFHGLGTGLINYDQRRREVSFEQERAAMERRISATIAALDRISAAECQHQVRVILEGDGDSGPSLSSMARELQFLLSHTIHHYALVAVILRLKGREVEADFGVAPSSLAYWEEQARCAR